MTAAFCCFPGVDEAVSPVDKRLISGEEETLIAPEMAASEEYLLDGTEAGCKVAEPV